MNRYVRVLLIKDNKLLMIKEKRKELFCWNFPGGKVEKEEDFFAAAKRELFEECHVCALEKDLYPLCSVDLHFEQKRWHGVYFFVQAYTGEPVLMEKKAIQLDFKSTAECLSLKADFDAGFYQPMIECFQVLKKQNQLFF
jgi:ADP-ribose pyrophosphatase YjhB (NUDIX family)